MKVLYSVLSLNVIARRKANPQLLLFPPPLQGRRENASGAPATVRGQGSPVYLGEIH